MIATNRVLEIFADAHQLHASAMERLDAGDIRDAAEKGWCATLRATNALILAKTGDEPRKSPATSQSLKWMVREDRTIRPLMQRYYALQEELHGECFYLGLCEPREETEELVRIEVPQFIETAEGLAAS